MKYYFFEGGELRGRFGGLLNLFSFSALVPVLNLFKKWTDVEDVLNVSLKDWLSEQTESEEAKRIFKILSTSLIITPLDKFDASLGELVRTIKRMVESGEGAAYPVGGWKTIIDKLVKGVENNGGEIRTSTKVDEVIVKEGLASGVKVNGDIIDADKIVLGIRHQLIDSLVDPEHLSDDYLEGCKSLKSNAGISLDMGTSKVVTDLDGLILSSEVPLIGIVTSNIDSSVAPEGKQLMTFLFIHSPGELKDKGFVKEKIEEYRGMIYDMIPGLEGNVEWERVLRMNCVDGAVLTPDQNYMERPAIETPIDNLYFASDTCGVPGGGGDISFASARECVQKILKG